MIGEELKVRPAYAKSMRLDEHLAMTESIVLMLRKLTTGELETSRSQSLDELRLTLLISLQLARRSRFYSKLTEENIDSSVVSVSYNGNSQRQSIFISHRSDRKIGFELPISDRLRPILEKNHANAENPEVTAYLKRYFSLLAKITTELSDDLSLMTERAGSEGQEISDTTIASLRDNAEALLASVQAARSLDTSRNTNQR